MFHKLKKIIFKIFTYDKNEIHIHKMKEKTFIIIFSYLKKIILIFFIKFRKLDFNFRKGNCGF